MSEEPTPTPDEDEDETAPTPEPVPGEEPQEPVEALLGLRDFLAVAPRRESAATTKAAEAGLQRWMHVAGKDIDGHYTMAEWQTYYAEAMAHT